MISGFHKNEGPAPDVPYIYISHWLFNKHRKQRFYCNVWQGGTPGCEHRTSLYIQIQNFTAHPMAISDWAVLYRFRTYTVWKFGRTLKSPPKYKNCMHSNPVFDVEIIFEVRNGLSHSFRRQFTYYYTWIYAYISNSSRKNAGVSAKSDEISRFWLQKWVLREKSDSGAYHLTILTDFFKARPNLRTL